MSTDNDGGEVGVDAAGDQENPKHVESEADLLQRQRKEKKELQATITNMKHSVSKNDKAKKKEVANKIAQLEAELAQRHAAELGTRQKIGDDIASVENSDPQSDQNGIALAINDQKVEVDEANGTSGATKAKKVTKAQKRREKKEAKTKENEKLIADSAQEAKQGVRYKEQQLFKSVLSSKGLSFHHVPADGDCLYNALVHQLSLCGLSAQVSDLRQHAATIMKGNRDDYLPFLTNNDGDPLSEPEFEEYCSKLLRPGVWGGHPELVALSTYYQRPIEVLQADAAPIMIGEQFLEYAKPLTITYHRHAFRLGEHYNSTGPAKEGTSDDAHDDID